MKKLVFFVGISHKNNKDGKLLEAFSSETNSGQLIEKIEKCLELCEIYKTNLVDFTPLNEIGKIRYPNKVEKITGLKKLENKINNLNPDLIILFGKQVYDFVLSNTIIDKSIFISSQHPSYIAVYKRKEEEKYINDLYEKIKKHL
ncbi:MAG: uracil-DNA glycosylase family protein [Candidatus Gracilibacteria bacterium]|nr:uracil-DNA glycosylase family protein [Candidatus Gracilibacteria bacterium]